MLPDSAAMAPRTPLQPPEASGPVPVLFVGRKPLRRRFEPALMSRGAYTEFRPRGKPFGGLWTCRGVDWVLRRPAGLRPHSSLWILVAPAPRLLLLDTFEAVLAAYRRYPYDYLRGRDRTWATEHHQRSMMMFMAAELDHEAIAADGYDGIEVPSPVVPDWPWPGDETLSESEQAEQEYLFALSIMFSGWDVPTILWYRWAFKGKPVRIDVEMEEIIVEGCRD